MITTEMRSQAAVRLTPLYVPQEDYNNRIRRLYQTEAELVEIESTLAATLAGFADLVAADDA